jgi:hypothetical protein
LEAQISQNESAIDLNKSSPNSEMQKYFSVRGKEWLKPAKQLRSVNRPIPVGRKHTVA